MTFRLNRQAGFAFAAGGGLALAVLVLFLAKPTAEAAETAEFGYTADYFTAAFEEELKEVGQISPQEFAEMFAHKGGYLGKLSFDPTKAKFFDAFNTNPAGPNQEWGGYDFRMSAEELRAFKKNGFVVSERMGAHSFAEQYYRIYARDLPVFITADSLLHAWHRSFDAILEELEETCLSVSLEEILSGMAEEIGAAHDEYGDGVLGDSLLDADYFLAVARSLLAGKPVEPQLDLEERVAQTLEACARLQLQEIQLFGRDRVMDFSQFKVRGHYEKSERLQRYFRAMMWCGRTDMRIAGGKDENRTSSSPRELGAAVVLNDLLQRADKLEQWSQLDKLIQTFAGHSDSMKFSQLNALLAKGRIRSAAGVKRLETLKALQDKILKGHIGVQQIRSDYVESEPDGPEKAELPRTFTFLGQRFLIDSWATSKIVADEVLWDEEKVQRRIPSALDVGFAVFANDHTVPALAERMTNSKGRRFRDGLNYQHNLAAVRRTIDAQDSGMWNDNLAASWLGVLRELSGPADEKYPEALRTQAWAMKNLNTQLASWSQLRHDTVLYVKQPYTSNVKCEYPAGFVEPNVAFWDRFEEMAARAAEAIENTPFPDSTVERERRPGEHGPANAKIHLLEVQKRQAAFFRNFAGRLAKLKGIAAKQIEEMPLTDAETKLLRHVVQLKFDCGEIHYNGWYPALFYKGREDSGRWDPLVADVHTNVPAPLLGDPGCVLTQGVGNIDLLLVAIDKGKDKMVYAGPLLSHYEFEMPGVSRKSDSEWKKDITEGKLPPRPEWTRSYLIRGTNPNVKHYKFAD